MGHKGGQEKVHYACIVRQYYSMPKVCMARVGRYWSFASRYIVQKYITILLFIAVIKDDCYIRVADCFIRVSRS